MTEERMTIELTEGEMIDIIIALGYQIDSFEDCENEKLAQSIKELKTLSAKMQRNLKLFNELP